MLFSFIFLKPSSIAAIPALSSEPSTVVPSLFIIPFSVALDNKVVSSDIFAELSKHLDIKDKQSFKDIAFLG